jgi:hypothetical protein
MFIHILFAVINSNTHISIGLATIGVDGEDTYFSHISITDISNMVYSTCHIIMCTCIFYVSIDTKAFLSIGFDYCWKHNLG